MTRTSPLNAASVRKEMDVAREILGEARDCLQAGNFRAAVSRAYYGAFHAATAVNPAYGQKAKTHKGTVALLARHADPAGGGIADCPRLLKRLMNSRNAADYRVDADASRIAGEAVDWAKEVVNSCGAHLAELPNFVIRKVPHDS